MFIRLRHRLVAEPHTGTSCADRDRAVPAVAPGRPGRRLWLALLLLCVSATATAQQFCNTLGIAIPSSGTAAPYPSGVTVSGITNPVRGVRLRLLQLSHARASDLRMLLVGPGFLGGVAMIPMSEVGGNNAVSGNLLLDDDATRELPYGAPVSAGRWRPRNYSGSNAFPAPAPVVGLNEPPDFAVYNGTNVNGNWQLFVNDTTAPNAGQMTGWCLEIEAHAERSPAEDEFVPRPNGPVFAATELANGDLLIAGEFDQVDGQVRRRIARLRRDGTPVPGFAPALTDPGSLAYAVLEQPDGRILIGGSFGTVSGVQVRNLVRLEATGAVDTSFQGGSNGPVHALALQGNGRILVGGSFSAANDTPRSNLARLNPDGSLDPAYAPLVAAPVHALLVQPDGRLLVGGQFVNIGVHARQRLARLHASGAVDTGFAPNFNNMVWTLALRADGVLLVGGDFTQLNGLATGNLARLDLAGNRVNVAPANGTVHSVQFQPDGSALVGGVFTTLGGQPRLGLGKLNAFALDLASDWQPRVTGAVLSLAVQSDRRVLIGGQFTEVNQRYRRDLARVHPDGTLDQRLNPSPNDTVFTLTPLRDGSLVMGGAYTDLDGLPRTRLSRLAASGDVDPGFSVPVDDRVDAVLQPLGRDTILIGGRFTLVGGQARSNFAEIEPGGTVTSFAPAFNGRVRALARDLSDSLYAAGAFTTVNGQPRQRLARIFANGTVDGYAPVIGNGEVYTLEQSASDGALFAGGTFASVNGVARQNLVKLRYDGSTDVGFVGQADGAVRNILELPDGKVLIAGSFGSVNGAPRERIARLNADGTPDDGFVASFDTAVETLVLRTDGTLIAGGDFTLVNGTGSNGLVILNADGSVHTAFPGGVTGQVRTLAVQQDGKLLVGGAFTQVLGRNRLNVARLALPGAVARERVTVDDNGLTWWRGGQAAESTHLPWVSIFVGAPPPISRIDGGWRAPAWQGNRPGPTFLTLAAQSQAGFLGGSYGQHRYPYFHYYTDHLFGYGNE